MTELETNINDIMVEKEQKIIPENIKKGVNVFGVIGTLEAGGGTPVEGVKQFATVEEMNASTGNKEGNLAIVYAASITNLTATTEFTKATLPDTVVLPEAFTGNAMIQFQAVDPSQRMDCWGDISNTNMRCDFRSGNPETDYSINYTSTDGITYTKQVGTPAEIVFDYSIKYGSPWGGTQDWNDVIGYFFQVGSADFNGLFEYKENAWKIAPMQLDTKAEVVYKSTFYGLDGVETGTLTDTVSNSFVDTNAVVYTIIQQKYDIMTPRVLTDADKTIDKNIYCIPTKTDGTPLLDTSSVTDMTKMFGDCTNLTSIPLLDTSNVTNMNSMFSVCKNLITIPKFDTTEAKYMSYMFDGCTSLTSVPELNTINATDMSGMFQRCTNLTEIPLLNTSKVTDIHSMFYRCTNLTSVPSLNTVNATDMSYTFGDCTNLTSIPLLNTSSVTSMNSMFVNCTNLTSIPLLNTSSVTSMNSTFNSCTNLTEIPELNTSSVTNMSYMFYACKNLTTIPLLNTSKVTNMNNMFNDCSNLSDESLNNILQMCINVEVYGSQFAPKKLSSIGLSQEQATKCQSLSNWSAFTAAGWTSGY